jgi:hypothetical protein
MDMPKVNGMNMMEVHDHLSNHRLGEEDMNMEGIHMVEVEVMNMVEEHPLNHRPEDEGTDMVEECPLNHRTEVESIDREDIDMLEDMTMVVEVVERGHEGVVFGRHWIGDRTERHQ